MDKTTATMLTAMFIIGAYIIFVLIYPTIEIPDLFRTMVDMALAFLFTTSGVIIGIKIVSNGQRQPNQ